MCRQLESGPETAKKQEFRPSLLAAWRNFWHGEEGASIVTISIMALLGFAGLAVDGSNVYFQNQRMQVAADAAALSGARMLAKNATYAEVDAEIHQLAFANEADSVTWTYINNNRAVSVIVSRTFPAYFASVYGHSAFTVNADADAQYATVSGAGHLFPMTLTCDCDEEETCTCDGDAGFAYGVEYTLHEPVGNAPGNFGWLRWAGDSPSAPDLAFNINYPEESPVISIGDWVQGSSGNSNSSSVSNAIDQWVGKPIIIPIDDQVSGTGSNTQYRVCSFAVFRLYSWDRLNKTIKGIFLRSLVRSDQTDDTALDYGARDVRLIR